MLSQLPIQPLPQKDELLSSWLTRLCLANRFFQFSFFTQILGCDSSLFARDIDRNPSPKLIRQLAKKIQYDEETLTSMSMKSYEGMVFESLDANACVHHLLVLGIYHRKRNRGGLQFCPLCLKNDKVPYFRKYWRFSFFSVCPKHRVLLQNTCPHCGAYLAFHRLTINSDRIEFPLSKLTECPRCLHDICECCGDSVVEIPILGLYRQFLYGFISNRVNFPIEVSHWLSIFDGLWVLASALAKKRSAVLLRKIENEIGLPQLPINNQLGLQYASVYDRFRLMSAIFWLLEAWPERLIELSKGTPFSYSVLSDYRFVPFWVESVFKKNFYFKSIIPSDLEFSSAIEYLSRRGLVVDSIALSHLLDVDKGVCNKRIRSHLR